MKRVRANGGARTALRGEGYVVLGGDYERHRNAAMQLGLEAPGPGEIVSVRVVPAVSTDMQAIELEGHEWRLAKDGDPTFEAPLIAFK